MASIKARVYEKLQDLAITPYIYPEDELPQEPGYPATVFAIISGEGLDASHDNGVVPFRRDRLQIYVYSLDFEEIEAAIEAYYTALANATYMLGDGESPENIAKVQFLYAYAEPDETFKEEPTLREVKRRSKVFYVVYAK